MYLSGMRPKSQRADWGSAHITEDSEYRQCNDGAYTAGWARCVGEMLKDASVSLMWTWDKVVLGQMNRMVT